MTSVSESLERLESYIESRNYSGYDCYDALNSPLLAFLSFGKKPFRILFIQTLKRFPLNIRPLLFVRKGHNPKGIGLCMSAAAKLYRHSGDKKYLNKLKFFNTLLNGCLSQGYSGKCWGYNFDWQSRAFFVPAYTPTIVGTSYIANGYLDAYEITEDPEYLATARSACDFLLNDLHQTRRGETMCFSYTPLDQTQVHNANLLGAALLARVYGFTREEILRDKARQSMAYSMEHQQGDGSWFYGEALNQRWIDSFHTGFNLESIDTYMTATGDREWESHLRRGYAYYIDSFFLKDGTPKYHHNRVYPVDIHSCAEAVIAISRLGHCHPKSGETLERVIRWTLENMQNSDGSFYFQNNGWWTNRIPYMRWSQAWMYLALSSYLTRKI